MAELLKKSTIQKLLAGLRQKASTPPALPRLPWPQADLQAVETVIGACRYGLDLERLLADPAAIRVFSIGRRVIISGLTMPETQTDLAGQPIYQGLCHDLAERMAPLIQQKLGPGYIIELASGHSPLYFNGPGSNHWFLIATPRDTHQPAALIDPSFGVVGTLKDAKRRGYQVRFVETIEEFRQNQTPYQSLPVGPDGQYTVPIPIGYLRDYVPTAVVPKNYQSVADTAMLAFCFQVDRFTGKLIAPFLALQDGGLGDMYLADDLDDVLPPETPLKRFLNHLQQEITAETGQTQAHQSAERITAKLTILSEMMGRHDGPSQLTGKDSVVSLYLNTLAEVLGPYGNPFTLTSLLDPPSDRVESIDKNPWILGFNPKGLPPKSDSQEPPG
jgi:hypothetical protein